MAGENDTMSNIENLINETAGISNDTGADQTQGNDGGDNGDQGAPAAGTQQTQQTKQSVPPSGKQPTAGNDPASGQPAGNAGGKPTDKKAQQTQQAQGQQHPAQDKTEQAGRVIERLTGKLENLTREARTIQEENTRLAAEVEALRAANTVGTQLGLQPQQQVMAMQLMAEYARNPLGALKYMLTEAAAAGHNINSLFEGGNLGVLNGEVVARLIDQRLAPFTQQREQQEQLQRARQEADREVRDFVERHPNAVQHLDSIYALIQRDETLTLREAYLQLEAWAYKNGYDFSQPLKPQIEARRAGGNNGDPGASSGATRHPAGGNSGVPLPNGRSAMAAPAARVNQGNQQQQTKTFNELDSRDIVRAAMQEAGYQI